MKRFILVMKDSDFGVYKIARLYLFNSYSEAMSYMAHEIEVGNCYNRLEDYTAIVVGDYKVEG